MRMEMHGKIVLLHTASTDMHCEIEAVWYTITVIDQLSLHIRSALSEGVSL